MHPLATLNWSKKTNPPEFDYGIVLLNDKWYVENQGEEGGIYVSPDLQTWSDYPDLPTPSHYFILTTYDSRLVIIGGREGDDGGAFSICYCGVMISTI